uniref:Uncharacterized protein n=1 Tax=viral metagenome TaxID=1070528 RepID=A0A6C0F0A2_9ZZZZ
MDFVIGILLVIFIIFILINFVSISVSNNQTGTSSSLYSPGSNNFLFPMLNNMNGQCGQSGQNVSGRQVSTQGTTQLSGQYSVYNAPSPVPSSLSLNNQKYDYNKYFYLK